MNWYLMCSTGCGKPDTGNMERQRPVFLADAGGKLLLSPSTLDVSAAGLDIRSLTTTLDSANITANNLGIRNLSGGQDSVQMYGLANVTDSVTATLTALQTIYLLTKNTGNYRSNTYMVNNTSTNIVVTITLQLAPVDSDAYYVADGSDFNLIAGGTAFFTPSKLMKYARLQLSAALLGSAVAFYFGRS